MFHAHKRAKDENLSSPFLQEAKKKHRAVIRHARYEAEICQNENIFSILSSNPSSAFKAIKSSKSSNTPQVPYIKVGPKTYHGERVIDGLFESISNPKMMDLDQLKTSPHHESLMQDYQTIKFLCSEKIDLPTISLSKSSTILSKIKPGVTDLFSISANHYIHAGSAGLVHFNLLLNAFIADVNNSTIEELNSVLALLLYKGHKKDRTLDTSYRTISTCPLVAKGLDIYVRELAIEKWNNMQADTQYQGDGSSHELASLLVTEAIQHSRYHSHQPIFLLFLDAMSAFDIVNIPYIVRGLYQSGMECQSVMYMENRLANRITYCEYNKVLVGPIYDEQGLEQGRVSSSDCYKLYNNELLNISQQSCLGVDIGGQLVVSAVGHADDMVMMTSSLARLKHL